MARPRTSRVREPRWASCWYDPVMGSDVAGSVSVSPFQTCGSCRVGWDSWDTFVVDPRIRLLGLQAVPHVDDASLLVFEHACGSSISILTKRLRHLLPGPADGWPSLRGTDQCPGHCVSLADLAACDRPCSNARDRDLIELVERLRGGDADSRRSHRSDNLAGG